MKNRCDGCGAKIQMTDPKKIGYIRSEVYYKNPDNFLCERCHNLKHYNKFTDVAIDERKFYSNIEKIAKTDALIVYMVDGLDLEGTLVDDINKLFPYNKIMMVINKFDLFLSSTKPSKVKNYIQNILKEKNIKVSSLNLISAKNEKDVLKIYKEIMRLKGENDAYVFGMTNVGKSSLINELIKVNTNIVGEITTSNMPSTTLDIIKVSLPDKTYLYDMPGIINKHQVTYYLTKETLNKVLPKKYIKPKTFQLNPKQTLFIGGFAYFNFLDGERASFVTNFSNEIIIHRTKLERNEEFFEKHKDDMLILPIESERKKMGKLVRHKFIVDGNKEISISGLGFVAIHGKLVVEVVTYENIKVSMREALI